MTINLTLFLIFIWCVNGLDLIDPKGNSQISRGENSNLKNFDSILDSSSCQSIVAYYFGKLKNKKSTKVYDVEFQAKLWIDQNKRQIYVQADKWNDVYLNNQDVELDFYYSGGNRQWCEIYDNCTIKFTDKDTNFTLDLNTASGDYFHLLTFKHFNNSFVLNSPIGRCTKHQLDGLKDEYTPDLSQLHYCVCCDEYEPEESLNCPNNQWSDKGEDITCKSIVGYYSGVFQNNRNPDQKFEVEFQTRLHANDTEKMIHVIIDQWNDQKTKRDGLEIEAEYGTAWLRCFPFNLSDCSIWYAKKMEPYFNVQIEHYNQRNTGYRFLWFPNFNNSFTLTHAIGQCTKHQYQVTTDDLTPNSTLYEYCLCCGDEYLPDPKLGCPKNQWK